MWDTLSQEISQSTGEDFLITNQQSVGGGDINQAWRISGNRQSYFLKTNDADKADMFAAEAEGLTSLAEANAIRVPKPICWGTIHEQSYLVMESLSLRGRENSALFGQQLARMHQHTNRQFGWHRNNTIGSTLQINNWEDNWIDFWRLHRLGFQLDLALKNGAHKKLGEKGEKLMVNFPTLFNSYKPEPSILHGDLWSGNWGSDELGNPVIYDPAVYFGDHEADLAMMELFGSPGSSFFAAYREVFPIDVGYPTRRTLYNLYHILNHYNLFRGGYAAQAESMIDRILTEI